MNKVLAIFAGKRRELGGCEIYRITMPFYHLEKHGHWKADWVFFDDLWNEAQKHGPVFWLNLVETYDLFVFPRFYIKEDNAKALELFKVFRELGKPVLYEVDDDYTNQHRVVIDGDAMVVARECDAVTVTTPFLAETMKRETSKEAYVLPNCIAPDLWFELSTGIFQYSDKVVIGLTGSKTHYEDWKVLADVLPRIAERSDVHIILMGFHPDYLLGMPNTTYLNGMAYDHYAQIIQHCDIVLTPVNEDGFNLGKSPLKAIEGMAARRKIGYNNAGAAVISSDHPIYRLAVQHNKTGIITPHTSEAWFDYITLLIEDTELRHALQIKGHEWVCKHHDISKKWSLWQNCYDAILRKKSPVTTPLRKANNHVRSSASRGNWSRSPSQ